MGEGKLPDDKILVAIHESMALIRVQGRGSFKVSASLKDFGLAAIGEGCRTAVFDMTDCCGMDSTFMGVLAGLTNRLRVANGKLVLLNLSPRARNLVATLGLDQIVESHPTGQTPAAYEQVEKWARNLAVLDRTPPGKRTTTEVMIEAHENLVRLTPDNAPRFQDVLTFLRENLKKNAASHPRPE